MPATPAPSLQTPAIVCFRRDLRLTDNPALGAAIASGKPLILLYIFEEDTRRGRARGGASSWWLDKSLRALSQSIQKKGGTLIFRSGDPLTVLTSLMQETKADTVYWNRRYEQPARNKDTSLKASLKDKDIQVHSFNASLLTEPWTFKTGSGLYYKVFTPYWRKIQASYTPPAPIPAPKQLTTLSLTSEDLDSWTLHPKSPDWSTGFTGHWQPGETGAHKRLKTFLEKSVDLYKDNRNRPDIIGGTSGLSAHLAFGEIGPAQIWRATIDHINAPKTDHSDEDNARTFLSEIAWREFSYVLLYHNENMATENYNRAFKHMPWREDPAQYESWCKGQTGYPMVDAGMRQLWQTGWMHNRVRMIVASFLTKHLLLPWQLGEEWFWDKLVDADPASNAASWQWTSGSGADAAPYFRVFNPITQGPKFDQTGDYVRKYCPELAKLPNKYIHRPWEAPPIVLAKANVEIGVTYPAPIIDHKKGRERALAAYADLKAAKEAEAANAL